MATRTFAVDKTHSELIFQVRHLVTKVRGRFTDFSGTIVIDDASPAQSSVRFDVVASSIDTGTPDRDNHLRSADFFEVETHPSLSFVSTKVTAAGSERYDVTGTLTMHGVSKEITLPVTLLGFAKDPWGNARVGFETETSLNRKDFGLTWNAALETGGFLVGDDVKVSISVQAVQQG